MDKWFGECFLRSILHGPLTHGEDLITINQVFSDNQGWNFSLISLELPLDILNSISAIPRQVYTNVENTLCWGNDISGKFNTKETYDLCLNLHGKLPPLQAPNAWIWKLKTSNKIKHFFWLCAQDRLPTKSLLFKRNILPDANCCCYSHSFENFEHVLRSCPKALSFWQVCMLPNFNSNLFQLHFLDW
ncbi:hypothetical protein ACH5RR_038102 [Cinchona calisaya]|uniref:Reverse transcriptase zinc-binding domain-containing protein n=1 Tax=Cinchona calisaya TaxID=153742 RepID=A0ABD2Y835_9GENT